MINPSFRAAHIVRADLAKIAAREKPETERFLREVDFLLEYFPPAERVSREEFLKGADQDAGGRLGDSRANRYLFNAAYVDGELAGASSILYMDKVPSLLIGFIRVAAKAQRRGIGSALLDDAVDFGEESAARGDRPLRYLVGEVETPENNISNLNEARKRVMFFRSIGMHVLGDGTPFDYAQVSEDGARTRLSLMLKAFDGSGQMERAEAEQLIRSIYSVIYDHLPPDVYAKALSSIISSIPDRPMTIGS
jgi:GNAT superfamily N-acetyltransferase